MKKWMIVVLLMLLSELVSAQRSYSPPIYEPTFTPSSPTFYNPYYGNTEWRSKKNQKPVSEPLPYKIIFKNDSVAMARARLDVYKNYYLNISTPTTERSIIPSETKTISTIIGKEEIRGFAADSCWLFKIGSGKINYYAYVPNKNVKYAVAIQKGNDGPVIPLTKVNLREMVEVEDSEVLKLVTAGKLKKAIIEYNKTKM